MVLNTLYEIGSEEISRSQSLANHLRLIYRKESASNAILLKPRCFILQ